MHKYVSNMLGIALVTFVVVATWQVYARGTQFKFLLDRANGQMAALQQTNLIGKISNTTDEVYGAAREQRSIYKASSKELGTIFNWFGKLIGDPKGEPKLGTMRYVVDQAGQSTTQLHTVLTSIDTELKANSDKSKQVLSAAATSFLSLNTLVTTATPLVTSDLTKLGTSVDELDNVERGLIATTDVLRTDLGPTALGGILTDAKAMTNDGKGVVHNWCCAPVHNSLLFRAGSWAAKAIAPIPVKAFLSLKFPEKVKVVP